MNERAVRGKVVKGRDGKPLNYTCNLSPLHLERCAEVWPEALAPMPPRAAQHPAEGGAE